VWWAVAKEWPVAGQQLMIYGRGTAFTSKAPNGAVMNWHEVAGIPGIRRAKRGECLTGVSAGGGRDLLASLVAPVA